MSQLLTELDALKIAHDVDMLRPSFINKDSTVLGDCSAAAFERFARAIEQAALAKLGAQEPVATVASFTNGSYHRNYKIDWATDVPAGTKLYAAPPIPAGMALDAARYQWLRNYRPGLILDMLSDPEIPNELWADELDVVIDAAMLAARSKEAE
jgi:hypothetical protein